MNVRLIFAQFTSFSFYIWGFPKMGYTNSWPVYFMENPIHTWMMTRGYPYDLGKHHIIRFTLVPIWFHQLPHHPFQWDFPFINQPFWWSTNPYLKRLESALATAEPPQVVLRRSSPRALGAENWLKLWHLKATKYGGFVHSHGGSPKWLVHKGKTHWNGWYNHMQVS